MKQYFKAEALVGWLNFLVFFMKATDKMVLIIPPRIGGPGGIEGREGGEKDGESARCKRIQTIRLL
jgi:hypothetical protein